MAVKTLYLLPDTAASGSNLGSMQDGGTAPTTATNATGWIVSTTAPTKYAEMDAGANVANATIVAGTTAMPDASINNTTGDSFRTPAVLYGTFAATSWTFNFALARSNNNSGSFTLRLRVFKSTDATGQTGLTELTGATQESATISVSAATFTGSITWSPGATITLNGEYLFFSLALKIVTAASNASQTINLRNGSGSALTTPDFVAHQVPSAGSVTLSGVAPTVTVAPLSATITPTVGAVTAAGVAPTSVVGLTIAPSAGAVAVTGGAATASRNTTITPSVGAVTSSAAAPVEDYKGLEWFMDFDAGTSISTFCLLSTSPLAAGNAATGFDTGTPGAGSYARMVAGSSTVTWNASAGPIDESFLSQGAADPNDRLISPQLIGSFSAGDWVFRFPVSASGSGSADTFNFRLRVYRSSVNTGAGLTEVSGGVIVSSSIAPPNNQQATAIATWSAPALDFSSGGYLFVQVWCNVTSGGSGAGTSVFIVGPDGARVDTPAFTQSVTMTPSAASVAVSGVAGTAGFTITPAAASMSAAGAAPIPGRLLTPSAGAVSVTGAASGGGITFVRTPTAAAAMAVTGEAVTVTRTGGPVTLYMYSGLLNTGNPGSGDTSTGFQTDVPANNNIMRVSANATRTTSIGSAEPAFADDLSADTSQYFFNQLTSGVFANGTWIFNFALNCSNTSGSAETMQMGVRMSQSAVFNGTGLSPIGDGTISWSNTFVGNNGIQTCSVSVTPGVAVTISNGVPYLYVEIFLRVTNSGSGSGSAVLESGPGTSIQTPDFQALSIITPTRGQAAITGASPTAAIVRETTPGVGAVTLSGNAPALVNNNIENPVAGSASIVGLAPTVLTGSLITPAVGAAAVTGVAGTSSVTITPGAGAAAVSGGLAARVVDWPRQPSAGSASIAGAAPTIVRSDTIAPPAGSVTVAGVAASSTQQIIRAPTVGAAAVTGQAASVTRQTILTPTSGAVVVAGNQAGPGISYSRTPTAGAIATAGQTPDYVETGLFTWYMDDGVSFSGQTYAKLTADWYTFPGYLSGTGWDLANAASGDYMAFVNGTLSTTATTGAKPDANLKENQGGAFMSNGEFGNFSAGTWVFNFKLQGSGDGATKPKGTLRVRVFKGQHVAAPDVNEVVTELTTAVLVSAQFGATGWVGNDLTVNVPITWDAPAFTLAQGEYIYVKVAYQAGNNPSGATDTWTWYYGLNQSSILSAPFQQSIVVAFPNMDGPRDGTLTLTGAAPSVTVARNITPSVGAVAASGQQATRVVDWPRQPSAGSASVAGQAAAVARNFIMTPSAGGLAATGQAATASRGAVQTTSAGAATLSGNAPTLIRNTIRTPSTGAAAIAGQAATVTRQSFVTPDGDTLSSIGQGPTVGVQRFITPSRGTTTTAGQVVLLQQTGDPPAAGRIDLDGQEPTLFREDTIVTGAGAVAFAGVQATPSIGVPLTPSAGAALVTGRVPLFDTGISDNAGDLAAIGAAPVLVDGRVIEPPTGDPLVDGQLAVLEFGESNVTRSGSAAIAGQVAVVVAGRVSAPDAPPLRVLGGDPTLSYGQAVTPGSASMQAAGASSSIVHFDSITPGTKPAMVITGKAPVMVRGRTVVPAAAQVSIAVVAPVRVTDHARAPVAGAVAIAPAAPDATQSSIPGSGVAVALGQVPAITVGIVRVPSSGLVATTGGQVADAGDAPRAPGAASLSIAGAAPLVVRSTVPNTAGVSAQGKAPVIVRGAVVFPATGTASATGYASQRLTDNARAPGAGTVASVGAQVTAQRGAVVTPAVGAVAATGRQGVAPSAYELTPGTGAAVLQSIAGGDFEGLVITPARAQLVATGYVPTPGYERTPGAAALALASTAPRTAFDRYITPAVSQVSVTGRQGAAETSAVVTPGSGSIASSSSAPTAGRDTPITPRAGAVGVKGSKVFLGPARGQGFKLTEGDTFKVRAQPKAPDAAGDSFSLKRDTTIFKLEKDGSK
jgi:hypothetical protein